MDRSRVEELHYITSSHNLASIHVRGILSHTRTKAIEHVSVASEEVQNRRAKKRVPGQRLLHHYANLYFDARNP
jgi:ssDNA thymidine ADP-ribosyltransferase, DarT